MVVGIRPKPQGCLPHARDPAVSALLTSPKIRLYKSPLWLVDKGSPSASFEVRLPSRCLSVRGERAASIPSTRSPWASRNGARRRPLLAVRPNQLGNAAHPPHCHEVCGSIL